MLRDHETERTFIGPRFLVRAAASKCTRSTQGDRRGYLKDDVGLGYCNITKCCTEVCPEHIKITDNAIIPLKERVPTRLGPVQMVWRKLRGTPDAPARRDLPVLPAAPVGDGLARDAATASGSGGAQKPPA